MSLWNLGVMEFLSTQRALNARPRGFHGRASLRPRMQRGDDGRKDSKGPWSSQKQIVDVSMRNWAYAAWDRNSPVNGTSSTNGQSSYRSTAVLVAVLRDEIGQNRRILRGTRKKRVDIQAPSKADLVGKSDIIRKSSTRSSSCTISDRLHTLFSPQQVGNI